MMALVSTNYEFLYLDVGGEGRQGDGGIWRQCTMKQNLDTEKLCLLKARHLIRFCYRNGNHRRRGLSSRPTSGQTVGISENAFGILAMRFRLFITEIDAHPDKVANCLTAACCLHNMLRRRCGRGYIPPGSVDYEDVDNRVVPE